MRRNRPLGHPQFGKAEPCDCVLREASDVRRARLERIGHLGPYRRFTFETFDGTGRGARALELTRAFAATPHGWLVLTGPSGSGKTHLAAAIANDCVDRGEPALFVSVPDLLDHLRSSYEPAEDELSYDRLFEQVRGAPLLVLDDIDAVAPTPWAREKLTQVLNTRYHEQLPTVFTTAVHPRQLEDRLATRLLDSRSALLVELAASSTGDATYTQVGGMTRERLADFQFHNFDLRVPGLSPHERESLEAAFRAARDFAEEPDGWLVFQGPNGCGKTHLAAAIANRALEHGRDVVFAVVPDFLDHLRRSYAPGHDASHDDLFDRVRNASLLVLDDLGAQVASPWVQEKLFQVVNYRSVSRLPTVVTTDRSIDDLVEANPRIAARMVDPTAGAIVTILAPHYRLGHMQPQRGTRRTR